MQETPTITSSAYSSSTTAGADFLRGLVEGNSTATGQRFSAAVFAGNAPLQAQKVLKENPVSLRLVKVVIADTNENLALADRILHKGEEIATDLTDQELYFDLDLKEMLKQHNSLRARTLDKKASEKAGKDVFLEPVRIRDLKMSVVTIASF